ncbi:MAG: RodZ domain-containing protein [Thiohalocapsa sp.]
MNADVADDTETGQGGTASDARPADPSSPGRALSSARRARKMEIARIATELRLSPETVDALERDDFDHLPSPVFVSGYIRTYARLLGLDPAPLVSRFHQLHPGAEAPPRMAPRSQRQSNRRPGAAMPLLALSAAAAIAVATFVWWSGKQDESRASFEEMAEAVPFESTTDVEPGPMQPQPAQFDGSQSLPSADEATAVDPTEPIASKVLTDTSDRLETLSEQATTSAQPDDNQPAEVELVPETPPESPAGPERSLRDSIAPAALVGALETEDPTPPADADTSAEQQVVIAFDGPCWVDIRDAAGELQLFGEMADGDRHVLGGQPPYSLVLGNASAVDLRVGGEPFDVRSVAKGNVARFDLDPSDIALFDDAITSDPAADGSTTDRD